MEELEVIIDAAINKRIAAMQMENNVLKSSLKNAEDESKQLRHQLQLTNSMVDMIKESQLRQAQRLEEASNAFSSMRTTMDSFKNQLEKSKGDVDMEGVDSDLKTEMAAMRATVEELKTRPPMSYAAAVGSSGGEQSGWTHVRSRGRPELMQFVLSGTDMADGMRGGMLGEHLEKVIKDKLGIAIQIANARVLPNNAQNAPAVSRRRVWFQVVTQLQASDIVHNRRKLAGSGIVIHDYLSTSEYSIYKALQPAWKNAKQAGKKVFWRRAALFVDGSEVKAPVVA
jgi:hypothetical protein